MANQHSSPHDRLFRETFSVRSQAILFFKKFLPEDISAFLDFESLSIQNTSFVNKRLETYYADIVYTCQWKNSDQSAILTFLLEHKSHTEKYPHLQLLRYQLEGYEYQLKQKETKKKKLSLIIPVILYHGERKWKARPFDEYFDLPHPLFLNFVPSFDYIFIGLREYADEEILAIGMSFLVSSLLLFKHKRDKKYVLNNYRKIFIFVDDNNYEIKTSHYLETLILYVFQSFDINKEEIQTIVDDLPPIAADMFTSTYDKAVESGKIKGEAIGIKKGEAMGIKKGEAMGIKKGEAIGIKKGEAMGIEKGEAIGIKKGEIFFSFELAFRLLEENTGFTDTQISDMTKVPTDIIAQLRSVYARKNMQKVQQVLTDEISKTGTISDSDQKRISELVSSLF